MADLGMPSGNLVHHEQYHDLRSKVIVPDTKSKTRVWLAGQVHERTSKLEAYKGQMEHLKGMIEVTEDEIKELKSRQEKLEKL